MARVMLMVLEGQSNTQSEYLSEQLDAKSYANIAEQINPKINISFITADEIQAKTIKITKKWKSPIPVPNTLKLHCIRPHGRKKLSVSTVLFGEIFNVIDIFNIVRR